MTIPAKQGLGALTEKEKATLRLIVRGHDAKSIARTLDLSVHTINERLREARRKVEVSSSREAARLLFEAEDSVAARPLIRPGTRKSGMPRRVRWSIRRPRRTPAPGVADACGRPSESPSCFLLSPCSPSPPPRNPSTAPRRPRSAAVASDPAAVDAAQNFVTLIDQKRWDASYAATGAKFHTSNTLKVWTDVSEKVRAPLGAIGLADSDRCRDHPRPAPRL